MTSSMAFKQTYRFLLCIIFVGVVLGGLVTSCSPSADMEMVANHSEAPIVEIKIASSRAANGSALGNADANYEEGTGLENYIGEGNKMRIYFFDSEDKYICRLTTMTRTDEADGNGFSLKGFAPTELISYSQFKAVVLANWTNYQDNDLAPGETTISDLVNKEWAQFNTLYAGMENLGLNPAKGRLMPFFGIHAYQDVAFRKGEVTTLAEPVKLLRAMAKIEVVFDNTSSDGTSLNTMAQLQSVTLCGYNTTGYCAPAGVTKEGDYDHNGNYDEDYLHTLHLVGNANDASASSQSILLQRVTKASATDNERWIGYIPEYQNLNADNTPSDTRSFLKIKFGYQVPDDEYYRLDFARYGDDGNPTSYFNIERNNLYRFTVKVAERYKLVVDVKDWTNAFDNNFEFQ